MALTTFDTHKFVRRFEQAGVPTKQEEVQARGAGGSLNRGVYCEPGIAG